MTRREIIEGFQRRGRLIKYYRAKLRRQFHIIANNHPLSDIRRN